MASALPARPKMPNIPAVIPKLNRQVSSFGFMRSIGSPRMFSRQFYRGKDMLIVVFGATGNVGGPVLQGILSSFPKEQAGLKIRAVTRAPDALRSRLGLLENVEVVEGELSVTGIGLLAPILEGANRIFLCLPQALSAADMVVVTRGVVDAAKKAGVSHIVRISSARIDAYLSDAQQTKSMVSQGPLGEAHIAGETYTREQGIGLTSVRPTSFTSNFVTYDLPSIKSVNAFASPLGSHAAVNWVGVGDIAAVAVRALLDPRYDGMILEVTGPPSSSLTTAQMKALLTDKCCRHIDYTHVSAPPPPLQELWEFLSAGGFDVATNVVLEVTGKAPQDFSDFLDSLDLSPVSSVLPRVPPT